MKFFYFLTFILLLPTQSCTYLLTGYSNNCENLPTIFDQKLLQSKIDIQIKGYNYRHFSLLNSKNKIEDKFLQPIQIIYILNGKLNFLYNCRPSGITSYVKDVLIATNEENLKDSYDEDKFKTNSDRIIIDLYNLYSFENEHTIIFISSSFKRYYKNFIKDFSKLLDENNIDRSRVNIVFIDELLCTVFKEDKG